MQEQIAGQAFTVHVGVDRRRLHGFLEKFLAGVMRNQVDRLVVVEEGGGQVGRCADTHAHVPQRPQRGHRTFPVGLVVIARQGAPAAARHVVALDQGGLVVECLVEQVTYADDRVVGGVHHGHSLVVELLLELRGGLPGGVGAAAGTDMGVGEDRESFHVHL
ncbi:hypothetical protein D3C86_1576330 [compost metagenome]